MPTPTTPPAPPPAAVPTAAPAAAPGGRGIPSEVFRAYDIRGIAPDPLSPELVHAIGWSIAREARALGETRVAIGRDGRLTGPRFRDALAGGLLAGGVSVVDMGQLPTPILYFGAREIGSGIMITGSHNPPDYNGLKITLAGETLFGERIRKLRERLEAHGWPATPLLPDAAAGGDAAAAGAGAGTEAATGIGGGAGTGAGAGSGAGAGTGSGAGAGTGAGVGSGGGSGAGDEAGDGSEEGRSGGATAERGGATLTSRDPREDYLREVAGRIAPGRRLRVAVDAGNGITGPTAPRLLRALGHEVIELHCEVDGRFPNHPPDTSVPESYADLSKTVVENQADLGLAFDGDGDRLGVVDGAGEIIWPDRFMMLYAEEILARRPGAVFVHDVKCTRHLGAFIEERGGRVVMGRTGHSYIKKMLRESGAALAGEMSGHVFFSDRWYGFDDALYAAARLLEILAASPRSPTERFAALPKGIATPEVRVEMREGEPERFMERFIRALPDAPGFAGARLDTLDGVRAELADGWALVRSSNTSPSLSLRLEADSEAALERIAGDVRGLLARLDPNLDVPL